MIVETVIAARSIWLMDMRSLNPKGRNLYRLLGPLLESWYGFIRPTEFDESKGVQYTGGEFSPSGKGADLTGVVVTIYNDGVVAQTCTNTDDSDLFLGRCLERLAAEGTITFRPNMVKRKRYVTEFLVKPDADLKPLTNFYGLQKLLAETVYPGSSQANFEVAGLVFDVDFAIPKKQLSFTFQRRLGVDFSDRLYYSHGPFSNQQHEAILAELEKALSA